MSEKNMFITRHIDIKMRENLLKTNVRCVELYGGKTEEKDSQRLRQGDYLEQAGQNARQIRKFIEETDKQETFEIIKNKKSQVSWTHTAP